MKKRVLLIISVFFISCQTLPLIYQPSPEQEKTFACPHPFLKENYELVHFVESPTPGNQSGPILGVTSIQPASRSISCVVMTPEGIVLFEADGNPKGLKIKRALPPFDSEFFAQNVMEDIQLIF